MLCICICVRLMEDYVGSPSKEHNLMHEGNYANRLTNIRLLLSMHLSINGINKHVISRLAALW